MGDHDSYSDFGTLHASLDLQVVHLGLRSERELS